MLTDKTNLLGNGRIAAAIGSLAYTKHALTQISCSRRKSIVKPLNTWNESNCSLFVDRFACSHWPLLRAPQLHCSALHDGTLTAIPIGLCAGPLRSRLLGRCRRNRSSRSPILHWFTICAYCCLAD